MHDNSKEQKINDIIKKAKIKFFKRDCDFTLFGIMAYKYIWEIIDLPEDTEGQVSFNLEQNDPEKNINKIKINEKFLIKDDYTHDNLICVIIHELLHILHRHGIQSIDKEYKELWQLACDHIIDRDCKKMKVESYQNHFNIIEELNDLKPKCSVIEAYNWLIEKENQFDVQNPEQDNNQNIKIIDKKTGEEYIVQSIPADAKNKTDIEKNKLNEITNQFINEARAVNNILNEKNEKLKSGNSNSVINKYLNKLLEVKIDWGDLLEKAIKTNIIMKPNNRSWRKLNFYYRPHGINLPGNSLEEEENIGLLIMWIDISGSINIDELKKFAYITGESLKYFEKIIVLVHNVNIVQILEFSKEDKNKYYDFIIDTGFKKGGGTSHLDCYEYVKENWNTDNKLKDELSMVISLTDGYSNIENLYTKYDWCKSIPTVFVCSTKNKFEDEKRNVRTININ